MRKTITSIYKFIKQVLAEYFADNVLKYSASLAYYTILSLAPLLVILIAVSGMLFGKEAMTGEVYNQITGFVGKEAALEIQTVIQNVHLSGNTNFATIVSIVILIIGATGIFGEMQDSLNKIWGLKAKKRKVWWKLIINRLLSFSLILSFGFALTVSLMLNALVALLSSKLNILFMGVGDTVLPVFDTIVSTGISALIFATIFKVLPDAKIKWKDVFVGALITSILFTLSKFAIGYYLGKNNIASVYGAAGSIIIIMLWIYYSSAILYLGAIFTKVYASVYGGKIYPNDYSTWIKTEDVPIPDITLKDEKIIPVDGVKKI